MQALLYVGVSLVSVFVFKVIMAKTAGTEEEFSFLGVQIKYKK